ncbi:PARP-domain-containing protein [Gonapodya prolifera JEL478]|uniref:Poly [ADP-ribose] polymerase n=1 Tax=Gonapodya prolifera (strain JEL478) TaxID=1344416 RepID=A0A139AVL4_GONPJ|nr:PARP-domain-containing protein [Gonapodya prolifera JEL478]|eukprot:KXS20623.1 PARP-domain-containing protein [Gonapodya prolifera JEL478]
MSFQPGEISAEYAKSNRSSCKACKSTIGQGSTRIGRHTQASQCWFFSFGYAPTVAQRLTLLFSPPTPPSVDGVMTSWFHPRCFVKRYKTHKIEDVLGFSSLRWEDQEALRKVLSGDTQAATAAPQQGSDYGPDESTDSHSIAYAASSRSKCVGCQGPIIKGQIRMSNKEVLNEEDEGRSWLKVDRWYHPSCYATKSLTPVDTVRKFSGWQSLPKQHLAYVDSCLAGKIPTGPIPTNLAEEDEKAGAGAGPKKKKPRNKKVEEEEEEEEAEESGAEDDEEEEEYTAPTKKGRGSAKRKRSAAVEEDEDEKDDGEPEYVARPTRRARGAAGKTASATGKKGAKASTIKVNNDDDENHEDVEKKPVSRSKKRAADVKEEEEDDLVAEKQPASRGRKRMTDPDEDEEGGAVRAKRGRKASKVEKEEAKDDEEAQPKRGRGRPKKAVAKAEDEEGDGADAHEEAKAKNTKAVRAGAGKKGKAKGDAEENTSKGKGKPEGEGSEEADEQKEEGPVDPVRRQADALWKVKDGLSSIKFGPRGTILSVLRSLGFPFPHLSDSASRDVLADVLTFGFTDMCPECLSGRLAPDAAGTRYRCVKVHDWGACPHETASPVLKKDEAVKEIERIFATYLEEEVVQEVVELAKRVGGVQRVLQKESHKRTQAVPASPSISGTKESFVPRFGATTGEPFHGMKLSLAGDLSRPHGEIAARIRSAGGTVENAVSEKTTLIVGTKEECEKEPISGKIAMAKELGLEVVEERYIDECIAKNQLLDWRVGDWRIMGVDEGSARKRKERKEKEEFRPRKMQAVTIKNSTAVDPKSQYVSTHHVYKDKQNVSWTAQLVRVDAGTGRNSYYTLQILERDGGKGDYIFLKSWGRVGTEIGQIDEQQCSLSTATASFQVNFEEKTGNVWMQKPYIQKANRYTVVDVDFGESKPSETQKITADVVAGSTLENPVADLIAMLFDVERMKQTMQSFEIDMSKMPLGKYSVLHFGTTSFRSTNTDTPGLRSSFTRVSNIFYSTIPHDFGTASPPLLDDQDLIQEKLTMLDTLRDIEIFNSLIAEENVDNKEDNIIDQHYQKLKCSIEVVKEDSDEFAKIKQQLESTHAPSHTQYSLEIENIFKVSRGQDEERFASWKENKSRKAPVTGYMFGKGIYFADMVSKSANYCFASPTNPYGLLTLCEVALGDPYEVTEAEMITTLPTGKQSTKGCGQIGPASFEADENGVLRPRGPPTKQKLPNNKRSTTLLYNEFIVYSEAQQRMRYLVKTKFNFGRNRVF